MQREHASDEPQQGSGEIPNCAPRLVQYVLSVVVLHFLDNSIPVYIPGYDSWHVLGAEYILSRAIVQAFIKAM